MIVFAVISVAEIGHATIGSLIKERYQHNCLEISPSAWLVATSSTAKELSDTFGLYETNGPAFVVITASGYWGKAPTNIWEWMRVKMEAPNG